MNCLSTDTLNLLADKFFNRKRKEYKGCSVTDAVHVVVYEIHTFEIDYEIHTTVKLDLSFTSETSKLLSLDLHHIQSCICDCNKEYTFVHVLDSNFDISDEDKHLVYDVGNSELMTYEQYADMYDLVNSNEDEFVY